MGDMPAAARRDVAFADACTLLAIALDRPTRALAQGVASGSLGRDASAIATELGVAPMVGSALDELVPLRLQNCSDDSCAGVDDLHAYLRREHTRLFEHPVEPAVYPFEGQFVYAEKTARAEAAGAALVPGKAWEPAVDEPVGLRKVRRMSEEAEEERPRLFVNPAALDAERCYRAFGLGRSADKNIPADSIVTELQFMAYLYTERARACIAGDDALVLRCTDGLGEFERLHASKWMKAFFDCCAQRSHAGFYRFVGLYGAALLLGE